MSEERSQGPLSEIQDERPFRMLDQVTRRRAAGSFGPRSSGPDDAEGQAHASSEQASMRIPVLP